MFKSSNNDYLVFTDISVDNLSGLTQANSQTPFPVDIYVLKTMIYCLNPGFFA